MIDERIRLGISACLLGEPVRFDGGHKRDPFLVESLGQFVDWVPVCPEVESGLGLPLLHGLQNRRRLPADTRWRAIARHVAAIRKHCEPGDLECRRRQRQAVLHWAYDSRKI